MRQIVLDTETTGLEVTQGHRLIEIGCIELINRRPTGQQFHRYLNPQREIDPGAVQVHGLTLERLSTEPVFADIAKDFLVFIEDAELIIHNAVFDLGFLNAELCAIDASLAPLQSRCSVIDTLILARERHPGQRNSLDALCKRYGVDNSDRMLHGALLDARILADVYLAMTGGQSALALDTGAGGAPRRAGQESSEARLSRRVRTEVSTPVILATRDELEAHEQMLDRMRSSGVAPLFEKT